MYRFQRKFGAMRSTEVIDIPYIENEAFRAFRRASQLSGTSVKAMLANAVPVVGLVIKCTQRFQREIKGGLSCQLSRVFDISYVGYVFSLLGLY